jgi:hypothetical protein
LKFKDTEYELVHHCLHLGAVVAAAAAVVVGVVAVVVVVVILIIGQTRRIITK